MAINEQISGKRIPTLIAFEGETLDMAQGNINVTSHLRTEDGVYTGMQQETYDIPSELAFVDSTGITGADVMQYLAEWFEHKMGK